VPKQDYAYTMRLFCTQVLAAVRHIFAEISLGRQPACGLSLEATRISEYRSRAGSSKRLLLRGASVTAAERNQLFKLIGTRSGRNSCARHELYEIIFGNHERYASISSPVRARPGFRAVPRPDKQCMEDYSLQVGMIQPGVWEKIGLRQNYCGNLVAGVQHGVLGTCNLLTPRPVRPATDKGRLSRTGCDHLGGA